ncbi:MAG: 1-acyl-sn-glycerol-3-phosphate acyltransferase [Bacilli bacterium]|nr:1-acyl-sn-glycerol-3-phosphate acyltransferase [Bacilli bacterium]
MKNNFGYRLLTPLMRVIFRLYYNPKIINKEFIPKEGSIVIASNHKHLFDQCLTIMATKRPINYMAKKEYFDGKFAWFFKFVGCIPVDRSKKDENSKKCALSVLSKGGAIGIFPEGTRNRNKKKVLLDFKYGAVSLAKKSDSYIIPCAVTGDYKFRSKNLIIQYGKPFKVDDLGEANDMLYKTIENLIYDNLKKSNRSLEDELDTHFV